MLDSINLPENLKVRRLSISQVGLYAVLILKTELLSSLCAWRDADAVGTTFWITLRWVDIELSKQGSPINGNNTNL